MGFILVNQKSGFNTEKSQAVPQKYPFSVQNITFRISTRILTNIMCQICVGADYSN